MPVIEIKISKIKPGQKKRIIVTVVTGNNAPQTPQEKKKNDNRS